jgi:hypothetical protein
VWQFGFEFEVTILAGKAFSLLIFRQMRKARKARKARKVSQ